ncbi:MAG: hypothetical protein KatS3mg005_1651 [Bryobacteraceae bacterium]|jgi:hypothetical protein|nr:MAG: hypothetical protein KatS3mg005_1651 [Bryobacteraceae bacterium]
MNTIRRSVLAVLLVLSSAQVYAAAIRPGRPPDPLRAGAAAAAERVEEARRPGPPPDPLRQERRG